MEEGTHEELVKLQGHYYKLLQAQTKLPGRSNKEFIALFQLKNEFCLIAEQPTEAAEEDKRSSRIFAGPRSPSLPYHRFSLASITSFNFSSQQDETDDSEIIEELPPAPVMRIAKYNQPEWWAILLGSLGAVVVGGSIPAVSVLFGDLYGVRNCNAHFFQD